MKQDVNQKQTEKPLPVEAVTFGAGWSDKAIAHIGFINKSQYREAVLFSGCHSAEKWHFKSYFSARFPVMRVKGSQPGISA